MFLCFLLSEFTAPNLNHKMECKDQNKHDTMNARYAADEEEGDTAKNSRICETEGWDCFIKNKLLSPEK